MKFFKNVVHSAAAASYGVASAALFSSLFLASGADAAPVPMHSSNSSSSNMYASIQYYGDFFTNVGDFKGHENGSGAMTSGAMGYDKSGAPVAYDPDYESDYIAGGISFGYSMSGGARIEIEGQYANIEVDDEDYKNKTQAKYLELTRSDNISGTYAAGSALSANTNAFSISAPITNGTGILPATATTIDTTDHLAAKFTNDGIRFIAGFINVGYDIKVSSVPVVPFVVVGLGFAQTKFLDQELYGLAYQAKAGIGYNISDNFNVFIAYNYRGSFSKEYDEVVPVTKIMAVQAGTAGAAPTQAVVASSDATVESTFGVHGVMAGVMVKF